MINRFEATGIIISVTLMAVALFLINMDTATKQLAGNLEDNTATVILAQEDTHDALLSSVDAEGNINKLVIDEVVVGTGEEAKEGDTVAVHYIGTLQNGQAFDDSYQRNQPFEFTIGEGKVIAGWEQGLVGMKVGGQRILVIPANLAYGNNQVGPIPSGSTLIFAIEMVELK